MVEAYDVALVPLIVGVVEVAKKLGMKPKFSPVVSTILGIVIGLVYVSPDDVAKGILVGTGLGLSAVGLYSGVKNTKEAYIEK